MRTRALPFCLLMGLIALGCGTKNRFIGTWESDIDVASQKLTVTHEFRPDLTYDATVGAAGVSAKVEGTYSFDADKITISGKTFVIKDDGSLLAKALVGPAKDEIEKRMKKSQTGRVDWRSDTEFAVQPDEKGVPIIVFRKKAS